MADELALFPLDFVLLPGLPLPLHVFEPRYRQLVADVSVVAGGEHGCFGVVLGRAPARASFPSATTAAAAGAPVMHSAAARAQLADIGTVADIVESEPYPDGRSDLLTVGTRRFRILEVDTESRPYVCASVEYLDEPVGEVSAAEVRRVRNLARRYLALLRPVSDTSNATVDIEYDGGQGGEVLLSYDIAARIQLTTGERQALLGAATAADRLRAETALLRRELAIFGHVRAVPVAARALIVASGAN